MDPLGMHTVRYSHISKFDRKCVWNWMMMTELHAGQLGCVSSRPFINVLILITYNMYDVVVVYIYVCLYFRTEATNNFCWILYISILEFISMSVFVFSSMCVLMGVLSLFFFHPKFKDIVPDNCLFRYCMFICITRKVYEYKWYYTSSYYTTWNFPVLCVGALPFFVSFLRWCA